MPKFKFSTGILSPINSDISLNDASIISSGSLPSAPPFDETESSIFESVRNDAKRDSPQKRNMKESTAAADMISNDKKKNINVEKEVKFKESYEMLKQSMDELVYKYTASSVLSPVSNDADMEKVFEAKNILFHSSVLSPVSNDDDVEKVTEAKNILPEIKNEKSTDILKSKLLRKYGSNESKSSQNLNSKSQKKRDSNARNSKAIEDNQQSKSTDPPQKSQKEIMKKNLKRLELQSESKVAAKLDSSVTDLQNPKDSKKISSSVQSHEISAESGSKEKENLKHFYTQKQKKTTISNSQSITEIQNLSIEKSIEITMSMEMDRLRGFILDQNMSLRKDLIKLHETVKRQNDVIGYLFSTIDDLKVENKKLASKIK